jgi:hypothetical protein
MIEYPKIETLYNRDPKTFKVIPGELRMTEFALVKCWVITEKIDGTNIRVNFSPDGTVTFGGRTERAQIPATLLGHLQSVFTPDVLAQVFDAGSDVTLFGEGYGERIQKDGGLYRPGVSFRLFDVLVGNTWLDWPDVEGVAAKLNIESVPTLASVGSLLHSAHEMESLMGGRYSRTSFLESSSRDDIREAEGVVARTMPLLLTKNGKRLMWKLKFKDFGEE